MTVTELEALGVTQVVIVGVATGTTQQIINLLGSGV
jgi:hypothetical protein